KLFVKVDGVVGHGGPAERGSGRRMHSCAAPVSETSAEPGGRQLSARDRNGEKGKSCRRYSRPQISPALRRTRSREVEAVPAHWHARPASAQNRGTRPAPGQTSGTATRESPAWRPDARVPASSPCWAG